MFCFGPTYTLDESVNVMSHTQPLESPALTFRAPPAVHGERLAAAADAAAAGGSVRLLLRLEGVSLLIAAVVMYERSGFAWSTFALYFLAPDIALLAYFAGNRIGAIAYNAAHSTTGALAAFSAGLLLASPGLEAAGMIWCAHIGFDRALGYGLKYAAGFGFTHLGRIGRARANEGTTRTAA